MGKPKHSDDTRGEQKGAQQHAEGQHGPKAYEARKAEINDHGREREGRSEREHNDPNRDGKQMGEAHLHEGVIAGGESDGRHRLMEGREQHDEADLNSGKMRLIRDIDRHDHDREHFQVPGGRETHPALPPDDPDGTVRSPHHGG